MIVANLKNACNIASELAAGLLVGLLAYTLVCGAEARDRIAANVNAAHVYVLGSPTSLLPGVSE